MSRYAAVNDSQETTFIASNTGWAGFRKWVEKLPQGEALDLRHLCKYGWDQDLERVRDQLKTALKTHSPKDEVETVARAVLRLVADPKDKKILTIV